jgi:mannose/cellobiose epimerase-like protein (N-acyl-D-glucosamine 2-epimerase family)
MAPRCVAVGQFPAMSDAPIAEQARDALRRHVLKPLAPRCIDQEYGGFLVDFDEQWRLAGPQDKSLEHATRTTIAFALIDQAMPGEGYEQFVRHGCAFLREAMWDEAHGGFFARVDRSGKPRWEGLKHPHAVTYAARAFLLAEPHLPPGEGHKWAMRALAWLDDVAWDPTHGGYWGSYRRDNERYADGVRLPTPDGRDIFGLTPGFKEINTQGDAIELLTEFVVREAGARCDEHLKYLVDLTLGRLIQPHGVLPYRYLPDWRPVPDLARVGYQFMMARHLLMPAVIARAPSAVASARALVDFALAWARHPAGGFSFAVTADGRAWPATGQSTDLRQWWVQIEAVHTMHVLATHQALEPAARARYREARDAQWAFVQATLFDERHGGVRELPSEAAPSWLHRLGRFLQDLPAPVPPLKSHCWKDGSHEVGTFLALTKGACSSDGSAEISSAIAGSEIAG